MANQRFFGTVMLAAGVLLVGACATPSAPPRDSLDERYFQNEARNYLKFEHAGQTVYCQNKPQISSLIPTKSCITETALRQRVENYRRSRNPVARGGPPHVATVPGGGG